MCGLAVWSSSSGEESETGEKEGRRGSGSWVDVWTGLWIEGVEACRERIRGVGGPLASSSGEGEREGLRAGCCGVLILRRFDARVARVSRAPSIRVEVEAIQECGLLG